jgi:geranylgeranyl reductase family protein
MYDVIIIGGGPAGSSAGYFLGSQGKKCLILDYAQFPRDKPCGGVLTTRIIKDFIEIASSATYIHYDKNEYTISHVADTPNIFFIRRYVFDNQLLNLAKEAKCEVKEKTRVTDIREESDKVVVQTADGQTFESKFVIGADGISSITREKSGLKRYWNKNESCLLFTSEVEVGCDVVDKIFSTKRESHLNINFQNSIGGYGWVFPKQNHINYGLGEFMIDKKSQDIKKDFDEYVTYCVEQGWIPKESIPSHPKSWTLHSGRMMKQFATSRIFLVGDSAGFVHPLSGEGIIFALWSSQILSNCMRSYFEGITQLEMIKNDYSKKIMTDFGNELNDMTVMQSTAAKYTKAIFHLAKFDDKLPYLIACMMSNPRNLTYKQTKSKLIKRVLLGVFKGNLWRK